jgi:hypothetical protein
MERALRVSAAGVCIMGSNGALQKPIRLSRLEVSPFLPLLYDLPLLSEWHDLVFFVGHESAPSGGAGSGAYSIETV